MLEGLVVAETAALVLLTIVVAGLLRSHGEVLRTLHEIGAGEGANDATATRPQPASLQMPSTARAAAPVVGTSLDGETVAWSFGNGRDTLVAFLSSGCEACLPFWSAFTSRTTAFDDFDVIVVANPEVEDRGLLGRLTGSSPAWLPLVMSAAAWEDFEVPGSPHFAYVDGHTGLVTGDGTAPGLPELLSFLQRAESGRSDARIDRELALAGVAEGDPRLYVDPAGHPA